MLTIAARLGIHLEHIDMPPGVLGLALRAERAILYGPSGYAPRDEFTVAHEIMELHIPRAVLDLPKEIKERFCDQGAAALLLPRLDFLRSIARHGNNVRALREEWPRVSGQCIKARLVECLAA